MSHVDTSTRPARVALYAGGGAPFHHAAIFARAGHEVSFVFPVDVIGGALDGFDAFVMPGGGYDAMIGQLDPLGKPGGAAIKSYVQRGGMYLGSCAGSYSAATVPQVFRDACPAQENMCLLDATVWNDGNSEWVGLQPPGIGVLRSRTIAADHPVMAGMPEQFEIAHYNGPFFTGATPLAVVAGSTDVFTPSERYLGGTGSAELMDRAVTEQVANIVTGDLGEGRVVLFGSHPEFGFTVPMDDPQPTGRMLVNAVEWQLAETGARTLPDVQLHTATTTIEPVDVAIVEELTACLAKRCAQLRDMPGTPKWIEPEHALSLFGCEPDEIWARSLDAIEDRSAAIVSHAADIRPDVLGFRQPDEWNIDGGFHGAAALLEQADAMLNTAIRTWNFDPGEPTVNPYQHMRTSPYHLVAGSYLAASGRVVNASLLCEAQAAVRF